MFSGGVERDRGMKWVNATWPICSSDVSDAKRNAHSALFAHYFMDLLCERDESFLYTFSQYFLFTHRLIRLSSLFTSNPSKPAFKLSKLTI